MADRTGGAAPPHDDEPTRARLVRLRGDDRRPMLGAVITVVVLAAAVLKPWGGQGETTVPDSSGGPSTGPGVAAATLGPVATPSATPPGYDAPGGQCYPGAGWRIFAVEMNTGHRLRTWLSIEPGPAGSPLDPDIPFVRIVTDRLLALGFCVGSGAAGPPPLVGARAFALPPGGPALPVGLVPLAEYMPHQPDLGAVYRPPGATREATAEGWSAGRYVFAVRQGIGLADEHWFGLEVVLSGPAPEAP